MSHYLLGLMIANALQEIQIMCIITFKNLKKQCLSHLVPLPKHYILAMHKNNPSRSYLVHTTFQPLYDSS